MKNPHLLLLSLALASAAPLFGQAPAAPAAPGTPATPADSTTPAATAPAAPGAAPASAEKKKPLSSNEIKALSTIAEAMQFHMRMGETAKWRGKESDKELAAFGTKIHKEMVDYWTPMVNMAQARGVDGKYIPSEVTKNDKEDISKLSKNKDDKYSLEYYELLAKQGKRYARSVAAAAKNFNDPEFKEWGMKVTKTFEGQADQAEVAFKELKNPKKK